MACSSPKEYASKNSFTFTFDGQTYQIISINTPTGEGTNYLMSVSEESKTTLNASDLNQDGVLDVLLNEDLTIEKANEIYFSGINQAKESGNFKERDVLRTYEVSRGDTLFSIRTYEVSEQDISNLFTVTKLLTYDESIFLDRDANGTLDSKEKGSVQLERAQFFYHSILQEGIIERRISVKDGIYRVKQASDFYSANARRHSRD